MERLDEWPDPPPAPPAPPRTQTPGERALDLLRRLVEGGSWYCSAIELGLGCHVDGEDAYDEAIAILRDAGINTE